MSQLGFCRIKVNTPSPRTYAHALEKRVPFPLCWGSQLLFPLSPKFPRFQSALAGFSASPDFNISPKKTKKQNAFSSKQLKHYVPISWAVIIHFIGVLLKKEKKKKSSENSFCTRNIISLFPASVLLMHIHPFLPPQILQKPLIPKSPSVFPSMLPWKCVPAASARIPSSSSWRWQTPATAGLGLDTRQTHSAQRN